MNQDQETLDTRTSEREPLAETVSVTFPEEPLSGPGQNISASGVYFIAEQDLRVKVRIGGREVEGQLVRIENHGPQKTGIARSQR